MLVLLFQWLAVHFFADFVLQTKKLIQNKKEYKAASWFLYVHCLLHAGLVYLLLPDKSLWQIPVIIFVTHYCIDLWKLYQKENVFSFIADQLLHIIVIIIIWAIWYQQSNWFVTHISKWLHDYNFWLIATAYLITIFPLAYILGFATQRWRKDIEQSFQWSNTSLSEAGKWIGIFERILVLTFVINNHFEGIGFLIAAKSILRFNDIKGDAMRKEAEYVLIGTLMSFASSIIVGTITNLLIK
jgi:hypothetical protein